VRQAGRPAGSGHLISIPVKKSLLIHEQAIDVKLTDYNIHAISALDHTVWIRKRHPIESARLGSIGLAQFSHFFERRDN